MAHPTEPGRISGETEGSVEVDASWLSAHEAARRANPAGRIPAVRTPMPAARELYPTPIYEPIEVAPLRQWVKPEPERPAAIRLLLTSLLRLSKPERHRSTETFEATGYESETLAAGAPTAVTSQLTSEQEEYLQRIRLEERRIADERRREAWDRLLTRYNGASGPDAPHDANHSGVAAALAPDPSVSAMQGKILAEVERWQNRSARLSSELSRAEQEKRAALLEAAEAHTHAEEARRATEVERKERLQAAEGEASAKAALAEAEIRADEERQAAARERGKRLRIAEEERAGTNALASQAQALAEQARIAETERAAAGLAEEMARAAQERRAAAALAEARAEAEEERLAALAHAEDTTKADEERRIHLREREDRLRVAEQERLAALAAADEARARAEEARLAEAHERQERVLAEGRERQARADLNAAQARAAEERRAQQIEREQATRASEKQRAVILARAEAAAHREHKRRTRTRPLPTSRATAHGQTYAPPRLARIEEVPSNSVELLQPLPPSVGVAKQPGPSAIVESVHVVAELVSSAAPSVLSPAPAQRTDTRQGPSAEARLGPMYAGAPAPTRAPGSLVLPADLRTRRGQLLDRRSIEQRPSRLRALASMALVAAAVSMAGLLVSGNANRAGVWVTELVERSPLPSFILARARPAQQLTLPPTDPSLSEYPGATGVVASVAMAFANDLKTLATNLRVADGPPAEWMTPEYIVRPSSYVAVSEYFRRLGEYAQDGPRLMPTLSEADISFRNGFAGVGLTSESLAQQAMSVYVGLQSAWNEELSAQQTFAALGSDFDRFLRLHEGSLTFRLGEFGHRSAPVVTEAARLQVELGQAHERMKIAESVVQDRMIDLTLSQ